MWNEQEGKVSFFSPFIYDPSYNHANGFSIFLWKFCRPSRSLYKVICFSLGFTSKHCPFQVSRSHITTDRPCRLETMGHLILPLLEARMVLPNLLCIWSNSRPTMSQDFDLRLCSVSTCLTSGHLKEEPPDGISLWCLLCWHRGKMHLVTQLTILWGRCTWFQL